MMTRHLTYLALALASVLLCGCDSLRRLAGRPDSEEIEGMRTELARRESLRQRAVDSLAKAAKAQAQALADSVAFADSIKNVNSSILPPSVMGGLAVTSLPERYYVIIGAFSVRENAESLLRKALAGGYKASLISFRNGFSAVGLGGEGDLPSVFALLKKAKEEKYCPSDAWILVNN